MSPLLAASVNTSLGVLVTSNFLPVLASYSAMILLKL